MALRKIRILLLVIRTRYSSRLFEEIGVCHLAAYLRREGYEVRLMEEYDDSLDVETIREFQPDLVGLPVYTSTESAVYAVCRQLKRTVPQARLCLGGYAPTGRGIRMMQKSPDIDFIIRGEGELPLSELAGRLSRGESLRGLRGLIYREEGVPVENGARDQAADLDSLPWPARDFIVTRHYGVALLSTARGCTRNCSFCASKRVWRQWRGRNLKDAVDEIEDLTKRYRVNSFYFVDCSIENPGPPYDRVQHLAEEIIRRQLVITYSAFFRPDFHRQASPRLLELLRQSGLVGALIGLESANPRNLALYRKHTTPEDNVKVVELFRDHGIYLEIGLILFNPYADFEGLHLDIDFLEKYGFAYDLSNLSTQYAVSMGCALDEKIQADGLITDEDDAYGYRFLDERVGRLAGYVRGLTSRLGPETNNDWLKIQRNIVNLAYWKRMYGDDRTVSGLIAETESSFVTVRDELNRLASGWFRALLELAETGWREEMADSILAEYFPGGYVREVCDRVEQRKSRLREDLNRLGYTIRKTGSSDIRKIEAAGPAHR